MWIVSELRIRSRNEVGGAASVQGPEGATAVQALENAPARHADVKVLRVARVDDDRMHFRAVRRAVLVAADPSSAHRIFVEPGDPFPRAPGIFRAEQSLRRAPRVKHSRLVFRAR